ncbi:MAG: hypothetical protein ACOC5T_08290, partial [Elusimicrobiota bacterium]
MTIFHLKSKIGSTIVLGNIIAIRLNKKIERKISKKVKSLLEVLKTTRFAGAIFTINKNMDKKKKNIGELLEDGELILKKSGNKSAA